MPEDHTERLEYLRSQINAESISYGELAELQSLADHIDPSDVQLLEWAGVPEFPDDDARDHDETAPDGDARSYDPETGSKLG